MARFRQQLVHRDDFDSTKLDKGRPKSRRPVLLHHLIDDYCQKCVFSRNGTEAGIILLAIDVNLRSSLDMDISTGLYASMRRSFRWQLRGNTRCS